MTLENDIYVIKTDLKVFNDEDGMEMAANSGVYDTATEILRARGNVRMKRGDSRLSCGEMVYYSREARALMRENPVLVQDRSYSDKPAAETGKNEKTKIVVVADEIEFFQNEDRILAKGNVRILECPSFVEDEELLRPDAPFINKINCESLELFLLEEKSINRGRVQITTPDIYATGDRAIYYHGDKRLEIHGHAFALQTENYKATDESHKNTIEGDRILYFPDEQRTLVVGNVRAVVYQSENQGSSLPQK